MSDNSAPIGALHFAMEMLIRQVSWTVAPGRDDDEGHDAAKFIFECIHDMEQPWEDTLADILTFIDYGWSLFEQVFKRRDGKSSKYDDGRIGWQGWQMRGQETLLRWDYEDFHANFPKAFVQLGPPDFVEHTIPMDKCLLFRTTTKRANPEGRSLWRNAYHSWYMAKHLEAIEAIGAERDMAGLPVGYVPSSILDPNAPPQEAQMRQAWFDLVRNVRRDEQEGILIPSDTDDRGNREWDLKLLSTGGTRQFNLGDVIERHEQRMLMTCLGDFIMLGHTNVGTQSLGKTKIELFTTAISAFLSMIAAQINDVAIPRLLKLNGMDIKDPPTLQHGQVERMDLDTLGNYIYQLGQAGFVFDTNPQGALMNHLMEQAHLPPPPEGLQNPFPDQWQTLMPNPYGLPPTPGNFMPGPFGQQPQQLPGQPPPHSTATPGTNPPGQGGMQEQPATAATPPRPKLTGKKRPSLKVPNQPRAPKAEPPHVHRGPLQSNGVLATAQRRSKQTTETTFGAAWHIARLFNELPPMDRLRKVAFDLDNTALRFPQVFVPMANLFADAGIQVGVMTGNRTDDARQAWTDLGYPEPAFFTSHPKLDPNLTATWKADECKRLAVDTLIDDFSGGNHADAFRRRIDEIGGDTVALVVSLPADGEYQQVGKGDSQNASV